MAIAAAGPIFNLVFAVAAFWLMYTVGRPDYVPIVGRAEAAAASAGFQAGDRITAVDGRSVGTWSDAAMALARGAESGTPVEVAVTEANGSERVRHLDFGSGTSTPSLLAVGLYPKHLLLPAVVGKVRAGSHAEAAGIKEGDRIVAIADQPIASWDEVGRTMQKVARDGEPLPVALERNSERLTVQPVPALEKGEDGKPVLRIGLEGRIVEAPYDTLLRYGPLDALFAACGETWRMSGETLALVGRMVTGNASLKNLSGPISIAQFANDHAKLGFAWFLSFLAVISLSLAIMNLLPIPVLDGGHLLYYLIELVKGSPVSERTMAFGQYLGLALLAGLMGLAFYNDILRLVS
jgi:regulator of sigma E protease